MLLIGLEYILVAVELLALILAMGLEVGVIMVKLQTQILVKIVVVWVSVKGKEIAEMMFVAVL